MEINSPQHKPSDTPIPVPSVAPHGHRLTVRSHLIRLVLACVVPVWLIAGFLVYYAYDSKRSLMTGHMLETARALSMSVDRELASIQAALQAMATSAVFDSGDLAGMHRQALQLVRSYPGADIIVADASGQQLINSYRAFGSQLPKRNSPETVQRIFQSGKPVVSDLFFGAVTRRPLIAIDVPVYRNGQVVYDLSMTLPSDRLASVLSHQELHPEWYGSILDSKGVVVSRTRQPEQFVGKTAGPAILHAIAGAAEGVTKVTNLEGVTVFDAFSRSSASNWAVVIGIPASSVMVSMYTWLGWAIGCATILSLFGMALAVKFGSSIAQSIQSLVTPAMQIGKGKPVSVMPVHSVRETECVAEELLKASRLLEERAEDRARAEDKIRQLNTELAATVGSLSGEIIEREQAEQSLQRLNRLYSVLSEINQAIVRAADRESLFADFCRITVEQGGFLLSWVGLVNGHDGKVQIVAACGATGYLDDIRITVNREPEGSGPTAIAIREGTHFICNDFQNDPCTLSWRDRGQSYGICASASIALKEEGQVIGALTLYAGEKNFFGRQQVELLEQMGSDVSFALDNLAREARRQKAEQDLKQEVLERLRAVEALREQEQLLLQQNRLASMGEMINNIAHQWRQPLNVLGLLIQQIQVLHTMGLLTQESLDTCVKKSMGSINHMSQTIDDFRNFFKPDKEQIKFKVHDVVEKTVSLVEDSFTHQQIKIYLHSSANPVLVGFPNEFCQVLLNILSNARDALQERRPAEANVTINLTQEGERVVVTIADNAGGIPEVVMGRIFEPYFTTKGPDKGTGVGLFMSKTIIEKNMNGRLTARNTTDGAEFRIEI